MIYESTVSFRHASLIFGIAYQTMVSMLVLLTSYRARLDKFWMHQDVSLSSTISQPTWPELEID